MKKQSGAFEVIHKNTITLATIDKTQPLYTALPQAWLGTSEAYFSTKRSTQLSRLEAVTVLTGFERDFQNLKKFQILGRKLNSDKGYNIMKKDVYNQCTVL